jgi:beta-glucanase (GH16 family)
VNGLAGPWQLVMDDEFNGTSLDTKLWRTCYDWGCTIATNPENEWYQSANVAERNGDLVLTAVPQASHGRDYTSGMVQSNGTFDFTYGFIEVRAKLPAGTGTWPAFWLAPANGSWPPEIDIMELWGDAPTEVQLSFHFGEANIVDHTDVGGPNFSTGYHTFAVDWEPGSITWYVDGREVYQVGSEDDELMYPIVNLAVADPPTPAPSTFPAQMDVDWIRVWQHPGVGTASCPGSDCLP